MTKAVAEPPGLQHRPTLYSLQPCSRKWLVDRRWPEKHRKTLPRHLPLYPTSFPKWVECLCQRMLRPGLHSCESELRLSWHDLDTQLANAHVLHKRDNVILRQGQELFSLLSFASSLRSLTLLSSFGVSDLNSTAPAKILVCPATSVSHQCTSPMLHMLSHSVKLTS